jgi:tetratricopeptide (TPR) repeat protein
VLAARLIATEGYGAERVERSYARALELAGALADGAAQLRVLLGLEGWHFMRADFAKARTYALEAAARAGAAGPVHEVQVQWALANIRMHQGDMPAAVRQMDECRATYDRLQHRADAVQDPGVMCLCYSAWSLWQLGQPDEALRRVTAVVERAEQLRHPFSLGEAFGFRAAVQHFRGENTAALASAEQAIRVCEEGGFSVWLAHARVMHGRVVAELRDAAAGTAQMQQAYEAWASTGAIVTTPFYLAMRAEGLALDGRPEEGLALLQEALAIVERCGERYYEPEIRRLHGVLALQAAARAGHDRRAEAERWFVDAHERAREARMLSLALRSAVCLAELWLADGRVQPALALLEPAWHAITEGRGTRDLVHAQGVLARARRAGEPVRPPGNDLGRDDDEQV